MNGGLEHIAEARAIAIGLDVEVQLERATRPGLQPMVLLLADARQQAMAAMVQLCIVDATNADAIRKLQNELIRFDDMVRSMKRIVEKGREADRRVTEEERAAIHELIVDSLDGDRIGATEVNDL